MADAGDAMLGMPLVHRTQSWTFERKLRFGHAPCGHIGTRGHDAHSSLSTDALVLLRLADYNSQEATDNDDNSAYGLL